MKALDRALAAVGLARTTILSGRSGQHNWPGEHAFYQQNINNHRPYVDVIPTVFSCINNIAQDISILPLLAGKRNQDDIFEPTPDSPVQKLLSEPNEYQTGLQMIASVITSLLNAGNSYVYTPRDGTGKIIAFHPLNPLATTVVARAGRIGYNIGAHNIDLIEGFQTGLTIPKRDVWHIPYLLLNNPVVGVSPMVGAAVSIAQHSAISQNEATFFQNQASPSGVLSGPNKISEKLAERIKTHWENNFQGGKFGRLAVLGEGLEWAPITMSAVDAQLIEQLRWTAEDIAKCFRMPLFMLGDLSRATFKNTDAQRQVYLNQCLRPIMEMIETSLWRHLGVAAESNSREVRFDTTDFFRVEADTRYANYSKALSGGWISINEVRRMEDYPPVEGGEEPRVQAQQIPLSQTPDVSIPSQTPQDQNPAPPDGAGGTSDQGGSTDATPQKDFYTKEEIALLLPRHVGTWKVTEEYTFNNIVAKGGSGWICVVASTTAEPGKSSDWQLLAAKGKAGKSGGSR